MAEYLFEPLDTDSEAIYQEFVDFVQTTFPDWNPSEGQLDVIIARYFAMQAAFLADMASRVQRTIYRYFGSSLAGIPPLAGSPARALFHFDVSDPSTPPLDRTLPYGTLIAATDVDGDSQIFALIDDLDITAGTPYGEVQGEAVEIGTASNNITGTIELVEMNDWVSSAYVVGYSSGGSDPEDDDTYLDRLTTNLALMAPRPILAQDFATFSQNMPGVWRAAAIDNFRAGALERQTLHSNYTGGTFTITFKGLTTAAVPATATNAQVRDAMAALSNFDLTDADFSGGPLPTTDIVINFKGKYAYTDVPTPTINTGSLTGGTTFTVTENIKGTVYATDLANAVAVSAVDLNGNPLDSTTKQNLIAYLQGTRAQNFVLTFVDPAYHQVDVTYSVRALPGYTAGPLTTAINTALSQYLSQQNWGTYPIGSGTRIWITSPNVRYLELTTVIENTVGVDYTQSLTFAVDGGTMDASDKTFTGAFSLTTPGTFTGTVTLPT